jgi:hypothetical protein
MGYFFPDFLPDAGSFLKNGSFYDLDRGAEDKPGVVDHRGRCGGACRLRDDIQEGQLI